MVKLEGEEPGGRIVGQKAAWQGKDRTATILNAGPRSLVRRQ